MADHLIAPRLQFLQASEALKDVLRSGHTSSGRAESTAEHTWRLALMALLFEDQLDGLDVLKILKLCIVHDLAEAVVGDTPAIANTDRAAKSAEERRGLEQMTAALDAPARSRLLALWEEYEAAVTGEARAVKAMDKLETIMQHNQGSNPADFDYRFNLGYGRAYTDAHPLFARMRERLDADTEARMATNKTP